MRKELDAKKAFAQMEGGKLAEKLKDIGNATPEEKTEVLKALTKAYANAYGLKMEDAMMLATNEMATQTDKKTGETQTGQFKGVTHTKDGVSTVSVNDATIQTNGEFRKTADHEDVHAALNQGKLKTNGDEHEYINLVGSYADQGSEFFVGTTAESDSGVYKKADQSIFEMNTQTYDGWVADGSGSLDYSNVNGGVKFSTILKATMQYSTFDKVFSSVKLPYSIPPLTLYENMVAGDQDKPEYMRGKYLTIGEHGDKSMQLRIQSITPYFDWITEPGESIKQTLLSGVPQKVVEGMTNRQFWNDQKITYKDGAGALGDYLYWGANSFLPLPAYLTKVYNTGEAIANDGEQIRRNKLFYGRTVPEAAAGLLGLNVKSYSKKEQRKRLFEDRRKAIR